MASLSRWDIASTKLSDQHGVWCAWCLEYISSPDQMELHHVWGKKERIRAKFGIEPWLVPVHSDKCHRLGLQDYADEAGRELLGIVTLGPKDFEDQCGASFYRGYLPACLFLRRYAWLQAIGENEDDQAREHLLFALNAAAGCSLGRQFVEELETRRDLAYLDQDADIQLYIASAHANAGELSLARKTRDWLASEVPRVRRASNPTYAKLTRMNAIVQPTLDGAREALSIARDSRDPRYHLRTSMLALASAYEAKRNYSAARAQAEELLLDFDLRPASWWHSIEQLFLWARAALLSEGAGCDDVVLRPPLKSLIRAQYASALLDFAGIPIPDFRESSQEPRLTNLMPTEVVKLFGERLGISKEEMTEIRRGAIFGESLPPREGVTRPRGFQANVLGTIRFKDIQNAGRY